MVDICFLYPMFNQTHLLLMDAEYIADSYPPKTPLLALIGQATSWFRNFPISG